MAVACCVASLPCRFRVCSRALPVEGCALDMLVPSRMERAGVGPDGPFVTGLLASLSARP
eukprot:scaffold175058_cov39-Tisochrysis_lutea.AAC.1